MSLLRLSEPLLALCFWHTNSCMSNQTDERSFCLPSLVTTRNVAESLRSHKHHMDMCRIYLYTSLTSLTLPQLVALLLVLVCHSNVPWKNYSRSQPPAISSDYELLRRGCVGNNETRARNKLARPLRKYREKYLEFEVLTAAVTKSTILWDITPCSPLSVNRRFWETYRLHIQSRTNELSKRPAWKQVAQKVVLEKNTICLEATATY
jgi:hypothetical protein